MDRETMDKLRLDRRLIRRRGWIAEDELEREIESLPDVASKAAPIDAGEASSETPAEPRS
jgi:hypothetical protein